MASDTKDVASGQSRSPHNRSKTVGTFSQVTNSGGSSQQLPAIPKPTKTLSNFFTTPQGQSVLLSKLQSGGIFLKHGSRGSPHFRFVWCSDDFKKIFWGDLQKKKTHGTLLTKDVLGILPGHSTKLFKERAPKGCDPARCFSFKTTGRTLDLEAVSEQEREMWVLTFNFLLEHSQAVLRRVDGKSMPSTPQKNVQLVDAMQQLAEDSASAPATGTVVEQKQDNQGVDSRTRGSLVNSLQLNGAGTGSSKGLGLSPSGKDEDVKDLKIRLKETEESNRQLQAQIEKWRDDNKKLYMTHVQKNITSQEKIDDLTAQLHALSRENAILKLGLQRSPNSSAGPRPALLWPKTSSGPSTPAGSDSKPSSPHMHNRSITPSGASGSGSGTGSISGSGLTEAQQRTLAQAVNSQPIVSNLNPAIQPGGRRTSR